MTKDKCRECFSRRSVEERLFHPEGFRQDPSIRAPPASASTLQYSASVRLHRRDEALMQINRLFSLVAP